MEAEPRSADINLVDDSWWLGEVQTKAKFMLLGVDNNSLDVLAVLENKPYYELSLSTFKVSGKAISEAKQ